MADEWVSLLELLPAQSRAGLGPGQPDLSLWRPAIRLAPHSGGALERTTNVVL
jgi:hypothetical protein